LQEAIMVTVTVVRLIPTPIVGVIGLHQQRRARWNFALGSP
jgi:hypothetical protein